MSNQAKALIDAAADAVVYLPELSTLLCAIAHRSLDETDSDFAALQLASRELDRIARELKEARTSARDGIDHGTETRTGVDRKQLEAIHHELLMAHPALLTLAQSLEREVLELEPHDTWGLAATARGLHALLKASTDRLELAIDPVLAQ